MIEFTWNSNYLYLLLQSILMSLRMEVNFTRKPHHKKHENKIIMFDLITESSLSLLFILYIIGKNQNKTKKKVKFSEKENKHINYLQISFITESKTQKKQKKNFFIYGLIIITSINKFYFSIFNYYISLKYFNNDYLITTTVFFNLIFIFDVITLAIIKYKFLKATYYKHNVVAIILLSILIFPISIIYLKIYKIQKFNLTLTYVMYFFQFFLVLFLIMINFLIYKILTEKNFLNIYLINSCEGILIIIYTIIFYVLIIKNQNSKKYGKTFDFSYIELISSCFLQIFINILIKFIVYKFNEMYEIIPYILQMVFDVIKNFIFEKYYKKNFVLFLILLILNILLVFDILFFTEIIILKVFGLEKKTKKYLEILQKKENTDNY